MHTSTQRTPQLKLYGAVLVLTALVATVVAIAMAGGAQAQAPTIIGELPPTCKVQEAPDVEPHEKKTGHFVLFDAYWEPAPLGAPADAAEIAINYCVPLRTITTETGEGGATTTNISLTASTSSAETLIIHVKDNHKVTVVDPATENFTNSDLRLDQYKDLRGPDPEHAWWLRLDDPNTPDINEQSDLTVGFSTLRFDADQWEAPAAVGGKAFRYRFVHEREPGIDPNGVPHFFAYRALKTGADKAELVWDSFHVGIHEMEMGPGEFEDLQWIFTEEGTYEISVHLLGYVHHPGPGEDWDPISPEETETSKTQKYVFHVGNTLPENEPPVFGVNLSVPENSPAGTPVGEAIPVYEAEADTLYYTLRGEGAELFTVPDSNKPHQAQIRVAEGAMLDYEGKQTYDLTLSVTDNKDHESNFDDTVDDILAVRISLEDEPGSAVLSVDNSDPVAGDAVTFTAHVTEFGQGHTLYYSFTDDQGLTYSEQAPHRAFTRTSAGSVTVQFTAFYYNDPIHDPEHTVVIEADPVTVTWRAADG